MANPYIEIFRTPGSFAFSIFGLIARCSVAMNTLSIVTMISMQRGHYGLASAVATTYAIAWAILAPQVSKMADRYGQTRVTIPTTIFAVFAMLALIIAVWLNAPNWVLFVTAAGIGVMPGFGAFVRARWSSLFRGSQKLHTAFAYESIIDETMFMVGPVIVVYLATHFFSEAGLLASAILLAAGAFFFCLQKKTEPKIIPHDDKEEKQKSVILMLPVFIVVVALLAEGAIFGMAEVTTVAFAKLEGDPSGSMWPLTAYALGSFIVGIFYGGRYFKMELSRQFLIALAIAALTTVPLLWVNTIPQLTLAMFVAGSACSPTIIIALKLVEQVSPPAQMTEGITWAATGMSVGFAIGMALAGQVIDSFGVSNGFYIGIGAGFMALILIAFCRQIIERNRNTT